MREIRKKGGEKGWKTFYYFSTDTRMPSTRVVDSQRWEIEVFHRIAKKELGLDFRKGRAIKKWICVVIIAYIILERRLAGKEKRARDRRIYFIK
ncbi:MAG: hypothetical protein QW228_08470 [Candidatus Aenigmatarchaeota archaeon]